MRKFVFLFLASLCGCSITPQNVAPPSTISLQKAMVDTVKALAATRKEGLKLGTNFQLYACTVTAVFNISATETVDKKLAISASAGPPLIPASVGGSVANNNSSSGTRANTVTVVLASNQCSPIVAAKGASNVSIVGNKNTKFVPVIPTMPVMDFFKSLKK